MSRLRASSTLFPYTTLFRSRQSPRRRPVEPLRIVDDTQQWALLSHHREQAEHRQPDNEQIRRAPGRSEEHTSELQSQFHLVCRLLLEKKKKHKSSYRVMLDH